jgi:hypothetical protein
LLPTTTPSVALPLGRRIEPVGGRAAVWNEKSVPGISQICGRKRELPTACSIISTESGDAMSVMQASDPIAKFITGRLQAVPHILGSPHLGLAVHRGQPCCNVPPLKSQINSSNWYRFSLQAAMSQFTGNGKALDSIHNWLLTPNDNMTAGDRIRQRYRRLDLG